MDTTNDQQINNQQQAVSQPQNITGNTDQQTTQYQNPEILKGKGGRTIVILIILLIIVIGIAIYLIFVNTIGNKSKNIPATTNILLSPTPIPATPTPQLEEFFLEDPETDIKTLDDDASTL